MRPTADLYMKAETHEEDSNLIVVGTFAHGFDECIETVSLTRIEALQLFDDLKEALLGD